MNGKCIGVSDPMKIIFAFHLYVFLGTALRMIMLMP